jgi:cobalt/nickel transport protein
MQRFFTLCLGLILVFGLVNVSQAHFGTLLPDKSMVMQGDKPELEVILAFTHPFEQKGMDLVRPRAFGVQAGKQKTDLLNSLQETKVLDKMAWKGVYAIKKPGIYAFYFDPQPYWEPAEEKFIIHQTKTYVAALGYEDEWDQEVGLKAEIIPLTRPFGVYTGNVFRGIVKFKGEPVPDADVEIEYWNPGKKVEAPNEYFTTLKVKTDKNGVFAYTPTKAGWWGFSAINEEQEAFRGPDGKKKKAEYGAVLWVQFTDMQVSK